MGELLKAALAYAAAGYPVFPVRNKLPLTSHGFKDASTDQAQVAAWWQRHPDAAIALRTGVESGLVVLDVDVQKGGAGTLAELERRHGKLPKTAEVLTGGGGRHLYFQHPGGREVRSSAGSLGPHVDVRGDGGYVVVPPSVHGESGREYRWIHRLSSTPLAPPPGWLLEDASARRPTAMDGQPILEGSRNAALASLAGSMRRRGMTEAAIAAALLAENAARCKPPLGEDEVRAIASSIGSYRPAGATTAEASAGRYDLNDDGNAKYLVEQHGPELRYAKDRKRWLSYERGRWEFDGGAQRHAIDAMRERHHLAVDANDKKALRHAEQSRAGWAYDRMLKLARTHPDIEATMADFDRDPWLLWCPNGTLDLRTGELREHDPSDLITVRTNVSYERDAACPRWERFLEEIFDGNGELVSFLRRAVGYSLTGDTREHVLFVCHGVGANGKSTLIETVKAVLGGFARTSPFESFLRTRGDRGPRNDLARLHRARMVVASEAGEGRKLDEATVKAITGGDVVAARFLYGEHFEFVPEFKLWLVTNRRPSVDSEDDALWRRLLLIPFEVSFLGREDKELRTTLGGDLPGILAWAVRGCLEWQREGLQPPPTVLRATAEYREEEDVIGAWLAEQTVPGGETAPTRLREAYEGYCRDLGVKPLSAPVLGKALKRRGIGRRSANGPYLVSLRGGHEGNTPIL